MDPTLLGLAMIFGTIVFVYPMIFLAFAIVAKYGEIDVSGREKLQVNVLFVFWDIVGSTAFALAIVLMAWAEELLPMNEIFKGVYHVFMISAAFLSILAGATYADLSRRKEKPPVQVTEVAMG